MSSVPPFSVLLPVYAGDQPEFIRQAFGSVATTQTLPPDEIVIVQDGPVSAEISACLQDICATTTVPTKLVALAEQRGLGLALDAGLRECAYDIIARMDADDIAMPQRFARQLPIMQTADIVGAGLIEFSSNTDEVVGRRTPPVGHDAIADYARAHDPFNHPTVVYRRAAVVAAGGYGDLPLMEDYWLFARMLANGARAENLAEPLVYYRTSRSAYQRRGGWQLLRSELRLQRQFRDEGFTTAFQHLRNTLIRGGYRLLPWRVRHFVYGSAVAWYRALTESRSHAVEPLPTEASVAPEPGLPHSPTRRFRKSPTQVMR